MSKARKKAEKALSPPVPSPDSPVAKGAKQNSVIALALILAFSLALGLSAVYQYRESPFFNLPIIDEEAYVKWGEEIARGDIIGTKVFYQDPLYPYFLGLIFALMGKDFLWLRVIQQVLGVASVGLTYLAARRLLGANRALLAAGILAACQGLYYFGLILEKAPLVIFLSSLTVALGVWAAEGPRRFGRWLGLGVTLGLLVLLRGNFQAVVPFLLGWAYVQDRGAPWRKRLLNPAFLAAGFNLVILPVTARNFIIGGELVLTTLTREAFPLIRFRTGVGSGSIRRSTSASSGSGVESAGAGSAGTGIATTGSSATSTDNVRASVTERTIIGSLRPRIVTSCCGSTSAASPAVARTSSEMTTSHDSAFVMS
jgi:hypothetical protein